VLSISVYVLYTLTELFIDFVNFLQNMGLTETEEYVVIGVKDDEAYDYSKAVDYMFHGKIHNRGSGAANNPCGFSQSERHN